MATVIQDLKKINTLIKNINSREEGYGKLLKQNYTQFTPGELMYYYYLKGKYFELRAKKDRLNLKRNLEEANEAYDKIFFISQQYKLRYANPKYIFKRANTKYWLAMQGFSNEEKKALLLKAISLFKYFPNYLQLQVFIALKDRIDEALGTTDNLN